MGMSNIELRLAAVERYCQSARKAEISDYWARITGKNSSLLKYEEVASRLHIRQQIPIGLQMVKLNKIVGSVGRYREFTKDFWPRATVLQDRWVSVDVTLNSLQGLPPVELYKVGDAYFVIDGNHRISVSRANENEDIEAVVTECQLLLPFTVEDFMGEQWVVKAAYCEFLTETRIHQLRPNYDFDATQADRYQMLLHHIAVHRYLANQPHNDWGGTNTAQVLTWHEAVCSWYDQVYLPIIKAIRKQKVHTRFPKRTETDLYLAITQYRERIAEQYGLAPLNAETAVAVFVANHQDRKLGHVVVALGQNVAQNIAQRLLGKKAQLPLPAGMSAEEFGTLRLRHDAGEISVGEAARKAKQECTPDAEPVHEGLFGMQFFSIGTRLV